MNATQLTNGTRVLFLRPDGEYCADIVQGTPYLAHTLLMPYAPNEWHPAVLLTQHTWCHVSDILRVLPHQGANHA